MTTATPTKGSSYTNPSTPSGPITNSNSSYLISRTSDSLVYIWSVNSTIKLKKKLNCSNSGGSLAYIPNDYLAYPGENSSIINIYSLKADTVLYIFNSTNNGHVQPVTLMAASESNFLATTSDYVIKLWDLSMGGLINIL